MPRLSKHLLLSALVLATVAGLGPFLLSRDSREQVPAEPTPAEPRPVRAIKNQEPRGSVAVLDFAAPGEERRLDSWAFGLADFMLAALQERDVVTLERRDLRYVLSERKLRGSGLTQDEYLIRQKLPWVRYLLKGTIVERDAGTSPLGGDWGGKRFLLTVSVSDTSTGLEAARLTAGGRYPDELPAALGKLADELLGKLADIVGAARRTEVDGFTRIPEVALLFYKGLDHFLNGRPEFAEEYFRQALMNDRDFRIAAVWRMRSYEALGLPDLARYVRTWILEQPGGRSLFRRLTASLAREKQRIVVSIVPPREPAVARAELHDALSRALAARPDVQVFSPDWIRSLSGELDLELSGELDPHQLADEPWLVADVVLTAGLIDDRLRIELIDAFSGQLLARSEKDSPSSRWGLDCEELVAEVLRERRSGLPYLRQKAPLDYDLPAIDLGIYSLVTYAYLLRAFADDPGDPVKLVQHLLVHSRHSHWEYEVGTYEEEWPYLRLLWDRLLATVDDDDPQAADWLSHVLWNIRMRGYLADGDRDRPTQWFHRGRRLARAQDHFAILLRRYPQSYAALCVRYYLALEHTAHGRHTEAARLLLGLAEVLPANDRYGMEFGAYANLYYFTAREARRVGRLEDARRYAHKALEAARLYRRYRSPADLEAGRQVTNVVYAVKPVVFGVAFRPPGFGGHRQGRFVVTSMARTIVEDGRLLFRQDQSLNSEIEDLARELEGAVVPPSLEELFRRAMTEGGASQGPIGGALARITYLERVIREVRRQTPLDWTYYYVEVERSILPWLRENISQSRRPELEDLVGTLIAELEANSTSYHISDEMAVDLYLAAGMVREVLAMAEEGLLSRHPGRRHDGILWQARGLESGPTPELARFLHQELRRYEDDFPAEREADYLDVLYRCARAYREAAQVESAGRIYQHGLRQTLFANATPGDASLDPALHHRTSLKFRWAEIEAEVGNTWKAAELFKDVAELAESHPDWLVHYSGHGAGSIATLNLAAAALDRLERLRGQDE